MERTHCGLYQAAATDGCEDIMASGKLLKLIRVFQGVSQSPLADRTGYLPRNTTNLRSPGRIQTMRALALLRATGSPARAFSEALSLVYGRLTEKELLTACGRLFCCFTL